MSPKHFCLTSVVIFLSVALAACNLPSAAPATLTPLPASPTVENTSSPTPEPPTETPLPSDTPTPAATETPPPTATETLTPLPSDTPTPQVATASVLKETNCRKGPGQMYDVVAVFQAGKTLEMVAADQGGGYWFVKNSEKPEESCYIWGNNIKIEGDTSALPAFTPPPTPTPNPDFTVQFKNYDTCKGTFARFIVVNTGGFQFRSAYVKVTNVKSKEVTESSVLAFDLTVGCVVAENISPLKPGGTGYLQSAPFKKEIRGDKLNAVFYLCTEQGLKGTCITKTLEVKP